MNPLNAQKQPSAAQYLIAGGMPSLTPVTATSLLKTNTLTSTPPTTATQQQQQTIITTTLNNGNGKNNAAAAANNNLLETKFVTTTTNYVPVLLTNQTLISSVGPVQQQQHQQQQPQLTKITPGVITHAPSNITNSTSTTTNLPVMANSNNSNNKSLVITTSNAANISYQVLATTQNNNLTPVITGPNGTVSVLLAPSQSISTAGHVAAPIIIRNTPTAITTTTTAKATQIKQQQLPINQQQHQQQQQKNQSQQQLQNAKKIHTFNPQSFNAEILKQIVVGNSGTGATATLAPGTTLLKPTILQNKPTTVQHQQQQSQKKSFVNNTMLITTSQQQQQHLKNINHTVITTTSDNSKQMFAALGMELVKAPTLVAHTNVTQNVQKLPQVSLLQNSSKRSTNIVENSNEAMTVLKNPNEIKVGNLNSEVSLIKKPNMCLEKSIEASLLKSSNKIQAENKQNTQQFGADNSKKNTLPTNKETTNESYSLLKSSKDSKKIIDNEKSNAKSLNKLVEKQKSLLKPKNKKSPEPIVKEARQQIPRCQRSNSCNALKSEPNGGNNNVNERRHSEPSKIETVHNFKVTNSDKADQETDLNKAEELDILFEDEEYLESSGEKSTDISQKSLSNNSSPRVQQQVKIEIKNKEDISTTVTNNTCDNQNQIEENEKKIKQCNNNNIIENLDVVNKENKTPESNTDSYDDDVTILPMEDVEIEQIEIDDDDDDVENVAQNNRSPSTDSKHKQLNESLLCDEQIQISSSSSMSNNSSDHISTTTSASLKSPKVEPLSSTPLLKKSLMEPKTSLIHKDEPQSNGYSSVLDMLSNFNMLNWREKIGTARGTNLKFQLNEFNLIQLFERNLDNKRIHTAYEKPIYERESSHRRTESNEVPLFYMCRRCNVQGPSVDFLAPEFCSLACLKRDSRKRRDDTACIIRKRNRYPANYTNSNNSNTMGNANGNNPPPLTYIKLPKFRWSNYLKSNYMAVAAPISLFLNPFPTGPNNFVVGMKLEAIDPENCSLFCVCTIIDIMGYRLKLCFDGYDSAYDFWLNADSMDIFPPGWCAKTNRILQPPKGINVNKFNWGTYLNKEKALPAPRHLFTHLNSSSLVPRNPFKIGMHLEAEDLNDTGKLCVASVADVLDDRIRIHFDGWDDCYDIIVDINSPYIHPCGWHEGRQQLVVPPDCENTAFNWADYIRKQGTGVAASEELFSPREPIGFKPNMKLEVVDPRNPSLIRPATVVSHKGHRVKLHLDGWPNDYCFWLEDDSPDLHPIGWCDATGHDLEPPPGFQMGKQRMPCSVTGCRGIGNAQKAFMSVHASRDSCPYAAENWRNIVEKPQRVNYENIVRTLPKLTKQSYTQHVQALQPRLNEQQILERLHMLDNIKTRNVLMQQDKLPTNKNNCFDFSLANMKREETKEANIVPTLSTSVTTSLSQSAQQQNSMPDTKAIDVNLDIAKEFLCDYGPRLHQNYKLWQNNFTFDAEKIKRNPLKWSTTEVSVFVDLYLNCRKTATLFNQEDIDGQAFLSLQQQDLTDKLGLKLGPAVKLYTCILQLRTLTVTKFEVPYKRVALKK